MEFGNSVGLLPTKKLSPGADPKIIAKDVPKRRLRFRQSKDMALCICQILGVGCRTSMQSPGWSGEKWISVD